MNFFFNTTDRTEEFPLFKDMTYLNTASIGIVPDSSLRAVEEFNRRYQTTSVNDDSMTFAIVERCRDRIAELIGSSAGEIAFMPNTSYGVNTAALSIGAGKGDNVVLPGGEFPANVLPWKGLERFGVKVRIIDPRPTPDDILRAIDEGTRCVAISLVSFGDGFRPDIDGIAEICHQRNIIFFVDGIQGIGNLPVDVDRSGIDILASGGQKWLISPWGSGFLYVSKKIMDSLTVPLEGWLSRFPTRDFSDLLDYTIPYPDNASRFEVGTPSFSAIIGMERSLEFILDLGVENIFKHSQNLCDSFIDGLDSRYAPISAGLPSSIVCFRAEKPREIYGRLVEMGFGLSLREGSIRVAFHLYNNMDDVEKLLDALS